MQVHGAEQLSPPMCMVQGHPQQGQQHRHPDRLRHRYDQGEAGNRRQGREEEGGFSCQVFRKATSFRTISDSLPLLAL